MHIASHWQAFARYLASARDIQRWQRVAVGADTNRRGNEPLALGQSAAALGRSDRHHRCAGDHMHCGGGSELGTARR